MVDDQKLSLSHGDRPARHGADATMSGQGASSEDYLYTLLSLLRHDFFGPLEAVINNMETMSEAVTAAQRASLSNSTHYAASKLQLTLSLLVDLADLECSEFEPRFEHFSVWGLLSEASLVIRSHHPAFPADSVHLKTDVDAVVFADRERLLRVISSVGSLLVSLLPNGCSLCLSIDFSTQQAGPNSLRVAFQFDPESVDAMLLRGFVDDPRPSSFRDSHVALGALHAKRLLSHLSGEIHSDYDAGQLLLSVPIRIVRYTGGDPNTPTSLESVNSPVRVAFHCESHPLERSFFDQFATRGIDFRPYSDPEALARSIEEHGSDVVLLRQMTDDVSFLQAARVIRSTPAGRHLPVLLLCVHPTLQSFRVARRFVSAVLGEPCTADTVIRYLVGMANANRRRRPRLVEYRSAAI